MCCSALKFPVDVSDFAHSLVLFPQVLYVVLSVCVAVLCVLKFGQEEVCNQVLGSVPGDSAIVFGKVGLWVFVLLFTWYVQHHHNRARRRGYLRFYRETQGLKQLPLTLHSTGTTHTSLTNKKYFDLVQSWLFYSVVE